MTAGTSKAYRLHIEDGDTATIQVVVALFCQNNWGYSQVLVYSVASLLQIAGLLQHRRLFEKTKKFFHGKFEVFLRISSKIEMIRAFHQ